MKCNWQLAVGASLLALMGGAKQAQAKDSPKSDVQKAYDEQQADIELLGAEWAVAEAAAKAADDRVKRTEKLITRHRDLKSKVNANYDAAGDEFVLAAQRRLIKERDDAAKLRALADDKAGWLTHARRAFAELRPLGPPPPPPSTIRGDWPPKSGQCSIDTDKQRRALNPNDCSRFAQEITQYGVGGRVLDRRGVTVELSASGSSTEVTLQLADHVNFRRPQPTKGELTSQRPWQLGYNFGIKSANSGRLFGVSERDSNRRIGDLDRLDEQVTIFGGVSFGVFPREKQVDFDKRSEDMYDKAQRACRAEMGNGAENPSTCEGDALVKWIFESKGGIYAHKEHVERFNNVYWGSQQAVPTVGGGYQLELGLPNFSYYPFNLVQVPDPFGGGEPARVADLANLPPSFLAGDPIKERHLTWAQTVFGFWHRPVDDDDKGWNMGTTFIASGTWKRSYAFPSGTKDVTICPTGDATAPAFSTELCEKVNIADVIRSDDFIGGLEVRQLVRGIPAIPTFGIQPKITHEFDRGRNAIDVPIFFVLNDKAKLHGGLRLAHEWGGVTAGGSDRKSKSELSIFFGTTFGLSPTK